ncbi:MAG: hypothetical protein DMD93_01205 [Candidatus Rokuibacteriota bacterium]|nr:MAG: hypothetical protein DMD93_01205 [Candidatus Rokubacteria bacterium]
MGLEIDLTYGVIGQKGGGPGKNVSATGTAAGALATHGGTTADSGLNTDVTGVIEMKWMYTEFDLTGKDSLLPFIPVETRGRAGLQSFGDLTDKTKVAYATGDFPGFSATTTFAPNLKTKLAYVVVESEVGGGNRGAGGTKGSRGHDFAVIVSPEYTVYKGLDIKPIYSFFRAEGATDGAARRDAADPHLAGGTTNAAATFGTWYVGGDPTLKENRHTIGFDASWRLGPWGFDPTLLYQWGTRDQRAVTNTSAGASLVTEAKKSAFYFDAIGSFQLGPLLVEARGAYTTGNKARDNLGKRISYYEPLDTDTGYYSSWGAIIGLSDQDYGTGCAVMAQACSFVGYDRYGRAQLGLRGTYALTPAFSVFLTINPTWTAEKVDIDTGVNASGSRTVIDSQSFAKGDSSYIGTETNIGFGWKFAPNVGFDVIGAYLASGKALNTAEIVNGVHTIREAKDAYAVSSRIRFGF